MSIWLRLMRSCILDKGLIAASLLVRSFPFFGNLCCKWEFRQMPARSSLHRRNTLIILGWFSSPRCYKWGTGGQNRSRIGRSWGWVGGFAQFLPNSTWLPLFSSSTLFSFDVHVGNEGSLGPWLSRNCWYFVEFCQLWDDGDRSKK